MKKKKAWVLRRHRVVAVVLRPLFSLFVRLRYGVDIKPFTEQNGRQYFILSNHQTAFDQFFIGLSFKGPIYYVASEDLFSNGFTSKLIKFLVNPIPFQKSVSDIGGVMNCLRVAKQGGTIALFPEGNRTFSGTTEYMKSSVAKLARSLKLPIALFRIEGGYGVHPRWSDCVRKGHMSAGVSRVIEPQEYAGMTDDELFVIIQNELYVDDTQFEGEYHHKRSAEYLERALYICPKCGLSEFESHGNVITCKSCGAFAEYLPDLRLSGGEIGFETVRDWYRWQSEYVTKLDPSEFTEFPVYTDDVKLIEVEVYKKKSVIDDNARIKLFGDRIVVETKNGIMDMPFDEMPTVSVLGKNKLNIYFGSKLYQIKGSKRFCAVKYINFYCHYLNRKKGVTDAEFLGL